MQLTNLNNLYIQLPNSNQISLRNELSLSINGRITKNFYGEIHSTWSLISNASSFTNNLPI